MLKDTDMIDNIIEALNFQLEKDISDAERCPLLFHDAPAQTQEMIDWFEQFRRECAGF